MSETRSITLSGRVQGVGFRQSAKQKAEKYNITGFVKNTQDNKVYIEATGSTEKLDEFEKWCLSGPSFARVTDISVSKLPKKDFDSFSITH
jgi:acylphosphatase